jgi:hypothetical protein
MVGLFRAKIKKVCMEAWGHGGMGAGRHVLEKYFDRTGYFFGFSG